MLIKYFKENPDLTIAALFAAVMTMLVPFDGDFIIKAINLPLLILLFCLMIIVAGFRKSGVLASSYSLIFKRETNSRALARFFIFACFFSSMLITNDVALIIFVPLSITMLTKTHLFHLFVPIIVLETIAANLGSILTPIGNPQNLFLYSYYGFTLWKFLSITLPVTLLSAIIIQCATYRIAERKVTLPEAEKISFDRVKLLTLAALFVLCLLSVLRIIPVYALLFIVVPTIYFVDRTLFAEADTKLLLLFVFLFVGVGNLSKLPFMQTTPAEFLSGHEFIVSLLLSQFISNVPATVMLAPYTDKAAELLLGVNIGGLGSIIASMASVISFKAYLEIRHSSAVYYLRTFSVANLLFLAFFLLIYWLSGKFF